MISTRCMFKTLHLIFCSFYWRCLSLAFVHGYDTCEKAALHISIILEGLDAEPEGV
jgi:hypothetical protein